MAETAQQDTILVTINGERKQVFAGGSIAAMLREIGIEPSRVAVERNLEIVPRSSLGEVEAREGDSFEIVHFVGGG